MNLKRGLYSYCAQYIPWIFKLLSDSTYLKMLYKIKMNKKLDLDNPKTFNEKLQWLKLYNRNSEYTRMVDKYEVRTFIKERIGEQYLIPLIEKWDSFNEIDFDMLPKEFVLKCNHDSHGLIICYDKNKINIEKSKKEFKKALKRNFYFLTKEWPYKNVKPCLIAEKLIEDYPGANTLTDYKFFCFDGKVDCVMTCQDREIGDPKFYFFNSDWELLRYNIRGKNAPKGFTIPKPDNIKEMFDIAAKLSEGLPFARIDLYSVEGKTYFGEITFFPDSGFDSNLLPEIDKRWGEMIKINFEEKCK